MEIVNDNSLIASSIDNHVSVLPQSHLKKCIPKQGGLICPNNPAVELNYGTNEAQHCTLAMFTGNKQNMWKFCRLRASKPEDRFQVSYICVDDCTFLNRVCYIGGDDCTFLIRVCYIYNYYNLLPFLLLSEPCAKPF